MSSRKVQFNQHEACVWRFSKRSLQTAAVVKVQHHQEKILVKDLLTAVAETLGMQKDNMKLFAIFEGPLLNPERKLEENDVVHLPCQKSLSIQKWSFDVEMEKIAVKSDTAALKLLRFQALSDIQVGRLTPSQEEMEKMEDYSDESFRVDHQFMSIIYSLQDYGAVITENCEVTNELTLPQVSLAKKESITLQSDLKGLTVKTGDAVCVIPWSRIYKVNNDPSGQMVEYEVYLQSQLVKWLRVETSQADYLSQVTAQLWKIIKERKQTENYFKFSKNRKGGDNNSQCKVEYPRHLANFDEI